MGLLLVQFGLQSGTDLVLKFGGQSKGLVVLLDGLLDLGYGEVGHVAVGALLLTADTEEVQVLALGVGDAKPATAAEAEDAGLQVVPVGALLLPSLVHGEHVLDSVKQGLRDQGLVAALVLDAAEADDAEVVAVGQETSDARGLELIWHLLAVGQGAQAFGSEFGGQSADRPSTGGVGLERPLHERCALGVHLHSADLAAVDLPAGVAVANRSPAGGAADLRLLSHALERLGGEVAAVELRDPGHDGVQQLA
nr:hypothetical protein [Kribbella sp. VKM Ac-2527]